MKKKILAIFYSQSGQLEEILDNFILPLNSGDISVEKLKIKPLKDFNFPWTGSSFFDAMPESVLGIPSELEPFELQQDSYDLILFAYQPWFLSPSIPANSALLDPQIQQILKNTPVITLIGARNMWLNAQEKVKKILNEAGANLVGNVALIDKNNNFTSAVSILHWMLTGKKEKPYGIFPKPGVSDDDILRAEDFGDLVKKHLLQGDWRLLPENLFAIKALEVKTDLMFIESRAAKLFHIWASVIIKKKNRTFWLSFFKYYLFIALFIVAPIVLIINTVLFKPFLSRNIRNKKRYYLGIN